MARKTEIPFILDKSTLTPHLANTQSHKLENKPGLQDLFQLLELQKTSEFLDLGDRFIADEGAAIVAQFITQNNSFTKIELKGNHLSSEGFSLICNALKECHNIKSIQAEWNVIGSSNAGLESLLELARLSSSLTSLDLRNNHLKPEAGYVLASIIRESQSLGFIDLRWNDLGSKGAKAVLEALKEQNRKIRVELSGNKVGDGILSSIREVARESAKQSISNDNLLYSRSPSKQNDFQLSQRTEEYISPRSVVTNYLKGSTQLSQHSTIPVPKEEHPKTNTVTDLTIRKKAHYQPQIYEEPTLYLSNESINPKKTSNFDHKFREISPPRAKKDYSASSNVSSALHFYSNYKNYTERKPSKPRSSEITFSEHEAALHSLAKIAEFSDQNETHSRWSPQKRRSINALEELERIRLVYQQEAEEMNQKYQAHSDTHLSLARSLQEETQRAKQLESDFQAAIKALEKEKRFKEQIEKDCHEMETALREKEILCSDLALRCDILAQEAQHLHGDNERLNEELRKVDEQSRARLKAADSEYQSQINRLTVQLEGMRREFERMSQISSSESKSLNREWELKYMKLLDQLREAERALERGEKQMHTLHKHNLQLQTAHQEQLQRLENDLNKKQEHKMQQMVKGTEAEIRRIGEERDEIDRKFENILREFQNFERKVSEEKASWHAEETRLKSEIKELRNLIGKANEERDNCMQLVYDRDNAIAAMERDIGNLKKELTWVRDNQRSEQDRFDQELNTERKQMNELLQTAESRNHELERLLKTAEEEFRVTKQEHERTKEILGGNINNFIAETFSEHPSKPRQRPVY